MSGGGESIQIMSKAEMTEEMGTEATNVDIPSK